MSEVLSNNYLVPSETPSGDTKISEIYMRNFRILFRMDAEILEFIVPFSYRKKIFKSSVN